MTNWSTRHGESFLDTKVLITGGAGFIGSHLCDALVALGARVSVMDDLSGGCGDNLEAGRSAGSVQFTDASILDEQALELCTAGCRYVFHQAALPSVPRSVEQPVLFHQVNATGTLAVLEAARRTGVERVVFAASSSAYGDAKTLPKVETMPPAPKSPYAANKLSGEHLMQAYASSYDLDTACLRYFNIFGPRQNANSAYAGVIAAFAKSLIGGQCPVIYGDGNQSRDFTYVDNAVHANLLAARSGSPLNGQPINVGCASQISINQLALAMAGQLAREDLQPRHEPPRVGDVMHSVADLVRAESLLGYRPIVDFDEGLGCTLAWYRQHLGASSSA